MKVYKIRLDVNHYQSFQIEFEGDDFPLDEFTFDGNPKAATWKPPEVFVLHPKLKAGDFYAFCAGAFAAREASLREVRMHLEIAGELLPLIHEGERFVVLNVTDCINVLDQERTVWDIYADGTRGLIRHPAFLPSRFTASSIFKIPEDNSVEIFTYEGFKSPHDEFKPTYERLGLTGLRFEEVWSDEEERFPRLHG